MKKTLLILAAAGLGVSLHAGCTQDDSRQLAHQNDRAERQEIALGATAAARHKQARQMAQSPDELPDVNALITTWPGSSRRAANDMMEKYGEPQAANDHMLVWRGNGPWTYTIVSAHPIQHNFPMEHQDVLEQFINYKVPPDKFDELAKYDGSVMCERTAGWISARCEMEEANFLALNLAHKIINDEMTVDEAREAYVDAVRQLMNGETPAITQDFQFRVPTGGTEDPGTSVLMEQRQ